MSVILNPVEQYFDLEGNPLQSGYLYFGEVYGNPVTQPVMVYFDPEFTIPAAQPVRTINGFPVRSGTATGIYAPDDVSILVQNQNKEQVIYIQSSAINTGDTTTIYRESNIELNTDDNNRTFIMLNSFTQTFEPSVNLGDRWRVNIINMSTGNIILDPNLSETIDGLATLQLQPNQILTVYCDGVNLKTTTLVPPSISIPSAATLDLTAVRAKVFTLTGTNNISTVQMINGDRFVTIAGGAYTLTNSATLIVQGNANFTATVGDIVTFTKDATTSNVYASISKKDGKPLVILNTANDPTHASTSATDPISAQWALGRFGQLRFGRTTSSGAYTPATAETLSRPHGLSVVPTSCRLVLKCLVANLGYAVGETVCPGMYWDGTNTNAISVYADTTNCGIKCPASFLVAIMSKSTGSASTPGALAWEYYFEFSY